jgi:hypothetical protein
MKRLLFLGILMLMSCAPDPRTIRGVDPEFNYYLDLYVKIKGKPLYYDIPIQFSSNMEPGEVGNCKRWGYYGYRQITIDKTYWLSADTNHKISLIFHELGHCDLNRDHVETRNHNGTPTSLMFPHNVGFIDADQDYYFNELFYSYKINPFTQL